MPMAAAERFYWTMILPIFDYCDVAWHGCAKVTCHVLESLQHRAAKIFSPNSGLNAKELNATLGLVPLINRRKLHIVVLARKCLYGSVPPYLNDCLNLNTSLRTFATRRFNEVHLPKVNVEVSNQFAQYGKFTQEIIFKRSFCTPESTCAQRNIQRPSNPFVQKREVVKRFTRQS